MDEKVLYPISCVNPGTFECVLALIVHYAVFGPIALILDFFGYDLEVYMHPQE